MQVIVNSLLASSNDICVSCPKFNKDDCPYYNNLYNFLYANSVDIKINWCAERHSEFIREIEGVFTSSDNESNDRVYTTLNPNITVRVNTEAEDSGT